MPGINVYEIFILVVLGLVLLGPERLPQYTQTIVGWAKRGRSWANEARERFEEETGTELSDVDWKIYDPRQYDPRKIIREALSDRYDSSSVIGSREPDPDSRAGASQRERTVYPRS